MSNQKAKERRFFEVMLILITLAMTVLLVQMKEHRMVILNLFYLPVILSGYYMGRTSSGLLALFSAISVTIAMSIDFSGLAVYSTPVMVGLVVTVWGGVLGLSALLIGTLCDERAEKVKELHSAYVGVVEVLAQYLQSGNPRVKARSNRVAELSQKVAERLKLSQKQIDDIRVGALLFEIGNVEITTKLITKAVDSLESNPLRDEQHTFQGMDFVHSLEPVLTGAIPLLVNQDDAVHDLLTVEHGVAPLDIPIGAKIIRTIRAYDVMTNDGSTAHPMSASDAVTTLRRESLSPGEARVIDALEYVIGAGSAAPATREPVAVS
jgi:HD-GYP domain-containing protein (c-di-GMP phosphodiesterase class II)